MAESRIFSINCLIPGGLGEYVDLVSDRSLLDADVIIFCPGLPSDGYTHKEYQGKTVLSESTSFSAQRVVSHWNSELREAVETGKTVVCFLEKPTEVFVYTGEKHSEGTGKKAQVTVNVKPLSSYDSIPIAIQHSSKHGDTIIPKADLKYLSTYWKEFGSDSKYEVYFTGKFTDLLLTTRDPTKFVGAAIRYKSGGIILLLPPLPLDRDGFSRFDQQIGDEVWTEEAEEYGHRLVAALVSIRKTLAATTDITPAPSWTLAEEWQLTAEKSMNTEIHRIDSQISELRNQKAEYTGKLAKESSLRNLLFEKGHPLADAVIQSLRIIGFDAQPFHDSESEFDVVFKSEEGRFLGEVEGKDNKSLNIDKLSQLERNLQEDFSREEVSEYAKSVLFGNAHRLVPPNERSEFFTEKCSKGAKRLKAALVRTPDLFPPVKYLKEHVDSNYSKQCREAILNAEGTVVKFPFPPSATMIAETETLVS